MVGPVDMVETEELEQKDREVHPILAVQEEPVGMGEMVEMVEMAEMVGAAAMVVLLL